MNDALNLHDITTQIQHYVRLISQQKSARFDRPTPIEEQVPHYISNEVRSNINPLNGNNKFGILNMLGNHTGMTSPGYASEAYRHLSGLEDKNKVVIDFMHGNNQNFDIEA